MKLRILAMLCLLSLAVVAAPAAHARDWDGDGHWNRSYQGSYNQPGLLQNIFGGGGYNNYGPHNPNWVPPGHRRGWSPIAYNNNRYDWRRDHWNQGNRNWGHNWNRNWDRRWDRRWEGRHHGRW